MQRTRKMPSSNGLTTTTVLNAVEMVTNLVKKTDYDAKISDIQPKYFTTS